jgi:hypothetical protein
MASVFMTALFALTAPAAAEAPAGPSPLDLSCYRLMADLAEDEDERVRAAGFTGAQYFLGRIDAVSPGFDPAAAATPAAASERGELIARCGALMGAGGRDFRAIGERLRREADPV